MDGARAEAQRLEAVPPPLAVLVPVLAATVVQAQGEPQRLLAVPPIPELRFEVRPLSQGLQRLMTMLNQSIPSDVLHLEASADLSGFVTMKHWLDEMVVSKVAGRWQLAVPVVRVPLVLARKTALSVELPWPAGRCFASGFAAFVPAEWQRRQLVLVLLELPCQALCQ